jgi:hypothetical protein
MDDHLAKPITLERLAAVLGRWIAGSGAADPSAEQPRPNGQPDEHSHQHSGAAHGHTD